MGETVSDIAVIVSLVCHNLGEILLVLGLSSHWVDILLKGWVLFEQFFALLYVLNDFFGLEYTDSSLTDIKLKRGSCNSHLRIAISKARWLWRSRGCHIESQASFYRRDWVETTVIIVSDLSKIRHRLIKKFSCSTRRRSASLPSPIVWWDTSVEVGFSLRCSLSASRRHSRPVKTLPGFVLNLSISILGFP